MAQVSQPARRRADAMTRRSHVAAFWGLTVCLLAPVLAACSSPESPGGMASTTATASFAGEPASPEADSASPAAQAAMARDEAETECGDAPYYWYPSGEVAGQPEYLDSWNWRFAGRARDAQELEGGQWRFVFANDAATRGSPPRADAVVAVDGVVQDGFGDTWCETHADGTFDVGIVGALRRGARPWASS